MKNKAALDKALRPILMVLATIFLLILIVESIQDYSFETKSTTEKADESEELLKSEAAISLPPLSDYAEIIERPLFMDNRRPFVPEEIAQVKPATRKTPVKRQQAEDFSLSAIIITEEKRIALIQSGRDKKLRKVAQGDELNGWIVSDVQPGRLSLKKNGETKYLELMVKGSPKQPQNSARQQKPTNNTSSGVTIGAGKSIDNPPTEESKQEAASGTTTPKKAN